MSEARPTDDELRRRVARLEVLSDRGMIEIPFAEYLELVREVLRLRNRKKAEKFSPCAGFC